MRLLLMVSGRMYSQPVSRERGELWKGSTVLMKSMLSMVQDTHRLVAAGLDLGCCRLCFRGDPLSQWDGKPLR